MRDGVRQPRIVFALVAALIVGSSPTVLAQSEPEGTPEPPGMMTIEVVTAPEDEDASFAISVQAESGLIQPISMSHGDVATGSRAPGFYSAQVEEIPAGWALSDITCQDSILGDRDTVSDKAAKRAVFGIDSGDDATCTFLFGQGRATVLLEAEPDDEDFSLRFEIELDPEIGGSIVNVLSDGDSWTEARAPGTYRAKIDPDPAPDWRVRSIVCDDRLSEMPSREDIGALEVEFALEEGEEVRCTFNVEKAGKVTLGVVTNPLGSESRFSFRVNEEGGPPILRQGIFPANDAKLKPGFGDAALVGLDGVRDEFELDRIRCREEKAGLETPARGIKAEERAPLGVDPGDEITCVFEILGPIVPRSGKWRLKNTNTDLKCRGRDVDAANDRPSTVDAEAEADGRRLRFRGRQGGQQRNWTLDQIAARRYRGTVDSKFRADKVRVTFDWVVINDRRMVGSSRAKFRAGSKCTLKRDLVMTFQGPN